MFGFGCIFVYKVHIKDVQRCYTKLFCSPEAIKKTHAVKSGGIKKRQLFAILQPLIGIILQY